MYLQSAHGQQQAAAAARRVQHVAQQRQQPHAHRAPIIEREREARGEGEERERREKAGWCDGRQVNRQHNKRSENTGITYATVAAGTTRPNRASRAALGLVVCRSPPGRPSVGGRPAPPRRTICCARRCAATACVGMPCEGIMRKKREYAWVVKGLSIRAGDTGAHGGLRRFDR